MIKNKRFREIEDKILQLFFEYGYNLTVGIVTEKLGISRSTFYRHHRTVQDIIPDYVKMMLSDVEISCNGCDEESIRKFFIGILIFIVKERNIFLIFLKMKNREVLVLILLKNEKMILKYADFKVEAGKIYNIYIGEVVAIVAQWGKDGFSHREINVVLSDILYLTRTMKIRLGPLV